MRLNPNGIQSSSPGLILQQSTPGNRPPIPRNPVRVEPAVSDAALIQPFQGWRIFFTNSPRVDRCAINPGLDDATPLALGTQMQLNLRPS
jgi:hypothetical protein